MTSRLTSQTGVIGKKFFFFTEVIDWCASNSVMEKRGEYEIVHHGLLTVLIFVCVAIISVELLSSLVDNKPVIITQ